MISGDNAASALEESFPGITSFVLNSSGANSCSAVRAEFPIETFFSYLQEACALDFNRCFGLLDLDIECRRQQLERNRLYEEYSNPHPNFVLGKSKDHWFSEMIIEKLAADRFHVTFLSTENWIQVCAHQMQSYVVCEKKSEEERNLLMINLVSSVFG